MKLPLSTFSLIFIICLTFFCYSSYAQHGTNTLTLTKISKESKTKQIDLNSKFKLKTIDGKKIKGRYAEVHEDYFTTTTNDTIYLNGIDWIKAKKQLTKWGRRLAIAGTLGGIVYSYGSTMAALMFIAMEANYWVILAPAVIIPATIIAISTISGRRYKLHKWRLAVSK